MEFVALGLGYFPWTTSNCYQSIWQQAEQQSRLEVTDERKRGSSNRGWRRGRRCSHRTVTHPHGQQHQYMCVIYRKDARLLFQDFHHCRCIFFNQVMLVVMFHHRKWKKGSVLLPLMPLKWVPSLLYCIFHCLSSPLYLSISHRVLSSGVRWTPGRSICLLHAPPSLSLIAFNSLPPFLFPNSPLIFSSPRICFSFWNHHHCQQAVHHLPWLSGRLFSQLVRRICTRYLV